MVVLQPRAEHITAHLLWSVGILVCKWYWTLFFEWIIFLIYLSDLPLWQNCDDLKWFVSVFCTWTLDMKFCYLVIHDRCNLIVHCWFKSIAYISCCCVSQLNCMIYVLNGALREILQLFAMHFGLHFKSQNSVFRWSQC